jgi:glycosyltransferase involved in cell wall biosynthesis
LKIYSVRQPGSEEYARELECRAAGDARISFQPALSPNDIGKAMQRCDLVAVPSRCLETGPLVVLEAFAAGTPILGTRLGGIAEIVTDRLDGILLPPDVAPAWATAIAGLAERPSELAKLRAGIRPPRTIDDVASEMIALYRDVLG